MSSLIQFKYVFFLLFFSPNRILSTLRIHTCFPQTLLTGDYIAVFCDKKNADCVCFLAVHINEGSGDLTIFQNHNRSASHSKASS